MAAYPWKRYWCRTGEQVVTDGDGFLVDPLVWHLQGLLPFTALDSKPCLVLLGEPGIGKSRELEEAYLRQRSAGPGIGSTCIDLRRHGEESRLIASITQTSEWKQWLEGDAELHLFFDGLDEGRLRISHLADVLVDLLHGKPLDRLFLRITCRTADWPMTLEQELGELYRAQNLPGPESYELVLLRRQDAERAAQQEGLDSTAFMTDVIARGAGALAAKPVTLRLLLKLAGKGQLPATQEEVYDLGCLELCTEPDPKRRERRETALPQEFPEPLQLLDVAGRIAAVTQLGNRYAVFTGATGDQEEGDVCVTDLTGGQVDPVGKRFAVHRSLVLSTLRTGLFSARGPSRLGWAHQTYAEYLAARSLRNAPLSQIKAVLGHAATGGRELIPQLHQTAAWFATLRRDVFDWILAIEPSVLLRSDVATVAPEQRRDLIDRLLNQVRQEQLLNLHELAPMYDKLKYIGIEDQLRPIIVSRSEPIAVRDAAIDMAVSAKLSQLADTLADVALDETEAYDLRVDAAHAVWQIGGGEVHRRMDPLARGRAGPDPDHSLRGLGMLCMWPDIWSTNELLENLVDPGRRSLSGHYDKFLDENIVQNIPPEDLSKAVRAAANWLSSVRGPMADLAESLMERSMKDRSAPGVLDALAVAVLSCLRRHHSLPGDRRGRFRGALEQDSPGRQALVVAMIDSLELTERDLFGLCYSGLVRPGDVLWMLEVIERAPTIHQDRWAYLIDRSIRVDDVVHWSDRLAEVSQPVDVLRKRIAWLFKVWHLNAPETRKVKAEHLRELRWQKRLESRPLEPPPEERLRIALEHVESGRVEDFFGLCAILTLEPTSRTWEIPDDIREAPGWKTADEDIRGRIVAAALLFITHHPPKDCSWLGTNEFPGLVVLGLPAFSLLSAEGRLSEVPDSAWVAWTPALLDAPSNNKDGAQDALCAVAYRQVPLAVLTAVDQLIEKGDTYFLHHLETCWDERLDALLFSLLVRAGLTPEVHERIAERLAQRRCVALMQWLAEQVSQAGEDQRDWQVAAARLILEYDAGQHWSVVVDVFHSNAELGTKVCEALAEDRGEIEGLRSGTVPEEEAAQLCELMHQWFPPDADPDTRGIYSITTRTEAASMRDSLLAYLARRGTPAAVTALQGLAERIPFQATRVRRYLLHARDALRRNTWMPPAPDQVLSLLEDPQRRYVESPEQLLEAVSWALERIEARWHGPFKQVRMLWNDRPPTPKDENTLSDALAAELHRELAASGVIVNREVQIKPGTGLSENRAPGQRTDLHVQASIREPTSGHADILTVVVEVKGCWHPELLEAMRTQLVERYLLENGLQCGVYLVGWYLEDSWADSDYRKKQSAFTELTEAQSYFQRQAKELEDAHPQLRLVAVTMDVRLGMRD